MLEDLHATDRRWMQEALRLAHLAGEQGEIPVGAVIVLENQCIAAAFNQTERQRDPCAHAEILALHAAAHQLGNQRMNGAALYVTLEPCLMCLGALLQARIDRLIYAAYDPHVGALSRLDLGRLATANHQIREIKSGFLQEESQTLLQKFFQNKR